MTLKAVSAEGPDAFYRGPIARAVVAASQANGGILTLEDFAAYSVTESAPVGCRYRGYRVISAPPPSSASSRPASSPVCSVRWARPSSAD